MGRQVFAILRQAQYLSLPILTFPRVVHFLQTRLSFSNLLRLNVFLTTRSLSIFRLFEFCVSIGFSAKQRAREYLRHDRIDSQSCFPTSAPNMLSRASSKYNGSTSSYLPSASWASTSSSSKKPPPLKSAYRLPLQEKQQQQRRHVPHLQQKRSPRLDLNHHP